MKKKEDDQISVPENFDKVLTNSSDENMSDDPLFIENESSDSDEEGIEKEETKCSKCFGKFKTLRCKNQHMKKFHREKKLSQNASEKKSNDSFLKEIKCPKCFGTFKTLRGKNVHMNKMHLQKNLSQNLIGNKSEDSFQNKDLNENFNKIVENSETLKVSQTNFVEFRSHLNLIDIRTKNYSISPIPSDLAGPAQSTSENTTRDDLNEKVIKVVEDSETLKVSQTNFVKFGAQEHLNLIDISPEIPSISLIPPGLASPIQNNNKKIGNGDKIINLKFNSAVFGPIYAKDDAEVENIFEVFKSKIEEKKYKEAHDGNLVLFYTKTSVAKARKLLPKDVVKYLDHALSKKELKRNIVGKNVIDYPARYETIKLHKQSESLIQPEYEHFSVDLDDLDPKLKYVCSKCPLKYDKKSELARHEMLKHDKKLNSQNSKGYVGFQNDQNEMKNKQSKNTKTFNCSKCYREFQKEKSLKQHVSLMHSENIFQCTFCQLTFKLESVMQRHQKKCTDGRNLLLKKDQI